MPQGRTPAPNPSRAPVLAAVSLLPSLSFPSFGLQGLWDLKGFCNVLNQKP